MYTKKGRTPYLIFSCILKRMDRLTNLLDVSRLSSFSMGADVLKEPRSLFILLGLVVLVLYGVSVGRTKALVSLLSIYVAYVLTVLFPFLDQAMGVVPEQVRVGGMAVLFLALYVVTFLLLSHAMARGRMTLGEISVIKVVIISVVQLGLLSSMTFSLLPKELAMRGFGALMPLVSGEYALWGWAAGSLAILPFMKVHRREN